MSCSFSWSIYMSTVQGHSHRLLFKWGQFLSNSPTRYQFIWWIGHHFGLIVLPGLQWSSSGQDCGAEELFEPFFLSSQQGLATAELLTSESFLPLTHLLYWWYVVACLYFLLWLCYSCSSVVPGGMQKNPLLLALSPFPFFQTRNWLFTSPIMPSILESFGLVILRSGAVSLLSTRHPVWPWLRTSSISHILCLRLYVTSSCVEDSLYFCFMFRDKFLVEKWFLLDFQMGNRFFSCYCLIIRGRGGGRGGEALVFSSQLYFIHEAGNASPAFSTVSAGSDEMLIS